MILRQFRLCLCSLTLFIIIDKLTEYSVITVTHTVRYTELSLTNINKV